MSDDISHESGRAEIAYTGETPWHGLGEYSPTPQTAQAMITLAHMDFLIRLDPLYRTSEAGLQIPSVARSIVRVDTNRELGVARQRYVPIQNTQSAEIMDALCTEGEALIEVAGALGHGERCWMLAKLNESFEVVPGDKVQTYFLLVWGHDGVHGVAGKLTDIRVVCRNTLELAGFGKVDRQGRPISWRRAADFYLSHVGVQSFKIEDAKKAIGIARKQSAETQEAYRTLAQTKMTTQQARDYFKGLWPQPQAALGLETMGQGDADRKAFEGRLGRWQEHQDKVLELFYAGKGTEIPGVRGTAWAAFNAVTEWTDHYYPVLATGKVSQARQQSVLFGSYADLKAQALHAALALAS